MSFARGLDGVWAEAIPVPRVVRGDAQVFPQVDRSYKRHLQDTIEQLEDKVLHAEARIEALKEQEHTLREHLDAARAALAEAIQGSELDPRHSINQQQLFIQRQKRTIAQLQAALREARNVSTNEHIVRLGRLVLNTETRRVEFDGQGFRASHSEMLTLAYLTRRPGRVFYTDTLGDAIGSSGASIRTFIWRLRPKLTAIGARGYLQSIPAGQGGGFWVADPERGGQS